MNRWVIWFGIGLADFFLFAMGTPPSHAANFSGRMAFYAQQPGGPLQGLLAVLCAVWLVLTIVAVPIGVIYWLVKGPSSSRGDRKGFPGLPRRT